VATGTDDTLFTVIRGGDVFAPDELGQKEILISGARILAIGESFVDTTAALGGARVIDATGMKVLPGFIDHVGLPIRQIVPTHVNRRAPEMIADAVKFARMGGTLDFSANLSQRSGSITGLNPDEAVRSVLDAGVPLDQITLSSDANVSMPVLDGQDQIVGLHNASPRILHREWLHIIRTNRLSLPQALPLVTSNVARVLGIDDQKGSLAPGKDADILLLTEDLMVDTVLARGRIMVRDGRAVVRGPFEERGAFDYGL
jgi:beta-aspartyl-dipeptidase (metallo-type)